MTANQIAFQSNIETERHNRVTEQELGRHNTATEGLQQQANELESWKIAVEKQYKEEANRIQDEYNRAYIRLQQAQGDKRLEIEEYLARIKQKEIDNELQYNIERNKIANEANLITKARNEETERHNKAMEEYNNTYMVNTFALENRKAEYMSTYYRDTISLGRAKLQFEKNASLRDYLMKSELTASQIGLISEQTMTEKLRQSNIEADTELKGSQNVSEGFHILWDGIDAVGGVAGKLAPLFMQ